MLMLTMVVEDEHLLCVWGIDLVFVVCIRLRKFGHDGEHTQVSVVSNMHDAVRSDSDGGQ